MGVFASSDGCDESWSTNGTTLIQNAIEYNNIRKSDLAKELDKKEDDYHLRYILKNPYSKSEELNNKLFIWKGDITTLNVDVIVNAARPSLLGGGGVDYCIHKRCGAELKQYCKKNFPNGCEYGKCKISPSFGRLKDETSCKYIIHTVGRIVMCIRRVNHVYYKKSYLSCLNTFKLG